MKNINKQKIKCTYQETLSNVFCFDIHLTYDFRCSKISCFGHFLIFFFVSEVFITIITKSLFLPMVSSERNMGLQIDFFIIILLPVTFAGKDISQSFIGSHSARLKDFGQNSFNRTWPIVLVQIASIKLVCIAVNIFSPDSSHKDTGQVGLGWRMPVGFNWNVTRS